MTPKTQSRKLCWPYTDEFVTGYPLTEDELFVLGVHWAELQLDNSAWCVLASTSGSTELRVGSYTAERLDVIAGILDETKMEDIYSEAEKRIHEKLGEEMWSAYKERRPLIRECIDRDDDA